MKRIITILLVCLFVLSFAAISSATNGDNLMGIGPIARAMGGVGIAAPQDAISAVFANPAAMCFGPYCPGAEVNFGGTLFMPKVKASVTTAPTGTVSADSDDKVYGIPAIGLSVPINNDWRFGLAAYGVSGLGVDYRGTSIANTAFGPGAPLVAAPYTQLQIMKFSPSVSYQVNNNLSLGLGVQIDYANLDLGSGSSFNYGLGAQLGAIYKITDDIRIGATYVTPQEVKYKNVLNFGSLFDLKLASPQQFGLGIAIEPIKDKLLIEADGKWINWSDAKGYKDFDWKDQYVLALGVQIKPVNELALRAGYNYGNNPVREHTIAGGPNLNTVQGITMPNYYYETFRIVGFPAIAKQHVSVGAGYEISKRFAINAGYTHAFKETIKETGSDLFGNPGASMESTLSENSLEVGFTWRF